MRKCIFAALATTIFSAVHGAAQTIIVSLVEDKILGYLDWKSVLQVACKSTSCESVRGGFHYGTMQVNTDLTAGMIWN